MRDVRGMLRPVSLRVSEASDPPVITGCCHEGIRLLRMPDLIPMEETLRAGPHFTSTSTSRLYFLFRNQIDWNLKNWRCWTAYQLARFTNAEHLLEIFHTRLTNEDAQSSPVSQNFAAICDSHQRVSLSPSKSSTLLYY